MNKKTNQSKKQKTKIKSEGAMYEYIKFMEEWNKDEKFKKWLEKQFEKVIGNFLFDFYRLSFNYAKNGEVNKDGEVVFKVNPSKKYHAMLITVFPPAYRLYKEGNKNDVIDGIVHELAHAHTADLTRLAHERFIRKEEIDNECEHLTEIVAEYVRRGIKAT
jgi:hypothetical protein